jgi:hypothetical protein
LKNISVAALARNHHLASHDLGCTCKEHTIFRFTPEWMMKQVRRIMEASTPSPPHTKESVYEFHWQLCRLGTTLPQWLNLWRFINIYTGKTPTKENGHPSWTYKGLKVGKINRQGNACLRITPLLDEDTWFHDLCWEYRR